MTKKTRLILLGGVLAVSVGAAAAMSLSKEAREDIRESGEVVFELPADEVTAVSWTYTDEAGEEVSLAFRTDGDGWIYDGDEAFPVDGEKIGELLDRFAELRAAFAIEDVTDTAQYGLEDPVCAIGLTAGDTDYEIRVGNFSELDSQRYLTFGDGTVYLVDEDPMDVYAAALDDFLLGDDIPAFPEVESIAFTGAEEQIILREEDIYYLDGAPLDTDRVEDYLTHLTALSLTDYATYKAAGADLASYGLDDPELTAAVTYKDLETEETVTVTVAVSRAPADRETPWSEVAEALEAAEESGEISAYDEAIAYLRVGESAIVYEIGYDDLAEILACSYDDLRHTEVLPADFEHVESLTFTLDGETYTFTRTEAADGDEAAEWSFNDTEIDIADVEDALTSLAVSDFEGGPAGAEEISLTAVLDLEGNPEVSVTLCRADGETCIARVDGEQVGSIPRSQAVALMEAVEADPRSGVIRTDNYDTYLLPTALDACPFSVEFLEHLDSSSPFGAKSLGEPAMEPAPAAILGAVNHALGSAGAVRRMPADLETVFFAAHPEWKEERE